MLLDLCRHLWTYRVSILIEMSSVPVSIYQCSPVSCSLDSSQGCCVLGEEQNIWLPHGGLSHLLQISTHFKPWDSRQPSINLQTQALMETHRLPITGPHDPPPPINTRHLHKETWLWWVLWLVTQLCPTLCSSMDRSPPGSSVCGTLQASILEGAAISYSRGSS